MTNYRKKYKKMHKKICGKCKPNNNEVLNCCFNGVGLNSKKLVDIMRRKNNYHIPILRDGKTYPPCPAFHPGSGCLIPEYRSEVCRSHYCYKWDYADKEIVTKGCFVQKTEDELIKHVKKIHPHVKSKYLILTNHARRIGNILSGIDLFIDEKSSFNFMNKDILEENEAVVTNTSLSDFLKDEELNNKWDEIKLFVLNHYLFVIN